MRGFSLRFFLKAACFHLCANRKEALKSIVCHPMYYSTVFEGLRGLVAGEGVSMTALAWGGALAVAYLIAACFIFAAVYRRAVRVGLIARYSAESLS